MPTKPTNIVNSLKCCGGTQDSTHGDFCYVLRSDTRSYGHGAMVECYYTNGSNSRAVKGANLVLHLPFRAIYSDIEKLNKFSFKEQPVSGTSLEWNPGLDVDSDGRLTTSIPSPTTYYEFNFTATELKRLYSGLSKKIVHENGRSLWLVDGITSCNVVDPKMMVEHDGATDYITICYNARVTVTGYWGPNDLGDYRQPNIYSDVYWTVPFVVRFAVTKSEVKVDTDVQVKEFSWTYGVNALIQYNTERGLNSPIGTPSTKGYNFGLIPTVIKSTRYYNGQWYNSRVPVSYGSTVDIFVDLDRSQVIHAAALGYYVLAENKFKSDSMLSRTDMSGATGYKHPTETQFLNIGGNVAKYFMVNKISLAVNGTKLAVVVNRDPANSVTSKGDVFYVRIVELTGGFTQESTYSSFGTCAAATVVRYDAGFILSYKSLTPNPLTVVIYYPPTMPSTRRYGGRTSADIPPNSKLYKLFSNHTSTYRSQIEPLDGKKFYPHPQPNKEVFSNIEDYLYKNNDIIIRPISEGVAILDAPGDMSRLSPRKITFTEITNPNASPESYLGSMTHDLYTVYDDNKTRENDYFYITNRSFGTNWVVNSVSLSKIYDLDIVNSTIQPEYWVNPVFAESEANGENLGVHLIISLLDCSGLYTAGDISTGGSWDSSARPAGTYPGGVIHGGIPLDPARTRSDITYRYYGTEEGYIRQQPPYGVNDLGEVRFGGSYTLVLENDCYVQLKYKGLNILAGADANGFKKLWPTCWKYDQSGLFNMYLDLYLDLDNVTGDDGSSRYDDSGFEMTNCLLTVDLRNNYGNTLSRFVERAFTISPPTASGTVTSNVGYKVLNSSVTFNLYRQVNPAASDFTTVRNIQYYFYDMSEGRTGSYMNNPSDYFADSNNGGVLNTTLSFDPSITLDKGDFVYVSYKPRLRDARGIPGDVATTHEVSCVRGHKFSLSNPTIEFNGDAGWTDVTDQIGVGNVFFYNTVSDLDVRATFQLNHETWPGRTTLSDYQIYPYIKNIYMFASLGRAIPVSRIIDSTGENPAILYEQVPPLQGVPLTYPNHTQAFAARLMRNYESMLTQNPAMTDVIAPGDTTLVEFAAGVYLPEITLPEPGEYQIWIMIEDEFNQLSCFCLTNTANRYNIPFRRV